MMRTICTEVGHKRTKASHTKSHQWHLWLWLWKQFTDIVELPLIALELVTMKKLVWLVASLAVLTKVTS